MPDIYDGFPYDLYEMFPEKKEDTYTNEMIFSLEDMLELIELISQYKGVVLWGGDLRKLDMDFARESWSIDLVPGIDTIETARIKGCQTAREYIQEMIAISGDIFLYAPTMTMEKDEAAFQDFLRDPMKRHYDRFKL